MVVNSISVGDGDVEAPRCVGERVRGIHKAGEEGFVKTLFSGFSKKLSEARSGGEREESRNRPGEIPPDIVADD